MAKSDAKTLTRAIQAHWSDTPDDKARRYAGQFFNTTRRDTKITAQVEGNHSTYTVSIQAEGQHLTSACIGMNSRHLSAIKSSELRNRYYNELGATKLACCGYWNISSQTDPSSLEVIR